MPDSIASVTALAALVKRNKGTVSRWLKRPDWPFARKAPWPQKLHPKILRWVADAVASSEEKSEANSKGSKESADAIESRQIRNAKSREEVRKFRAQADTAELQLARERGEMVAVADVESRWVTMCTTIRNAFESLGPQLVAIAVNHGLPSEAAPNFQEQAEGAVAGILRRLSGNGAA